MFTIGLPKKTKCPKSKLPSFTPILSHLSVNEALSDQYTRVYVYGTNFLPFGTTYIQFGTYALPVTYYSSFTISFVVPLHLPPNTYPVTAVNIYNGNFSLPVNASYPANTNVSNKLFFVVALI